MSDRRQHAYSTDNPDVVAAYRIAVEQRNTFGKRIAAAVEALGAGPRVHVRGGAMSGDSQRVVGLEQKGDHIPDGWRFLKSSGTLEPRRGKPGDPARQWLADHQPVDVRTVMEAEGLPRSVWIPTEGFSYRIVLPELFEHDGTLWAMYEAEPGTSDTGFDSEPCTWTPRKLSEFHAAREAFEAARV